MVPVRDRGGCRSYVSIFTPIPTTSSSRVTMGFQVFCDRLRPTPLVDQPSPGRVAWDRHRHWRLQSGKRTACCGDCSPSHAHCASGCASDGYPPHDAGRAATRQGLARNTRSPCAFQPSWRRGSVKEFRGPKAHLSPMGTSSVSAWLRRVPGQDEPSQSRGRGTKQADMAPEHRYPDGRPRKGEPERKNL